MAMGKPEEARYILDEALVATKGDTSVNANLAILLEQQGLFTEAIGAASAILANAPEHPSARFTLGLALLKLGRAEESSQHFRLLASAYPDNPNVYLNLGEALMATDAYSAALDAYSRAVALNPVLIAARIGIGQALAMLSQFNEANSQFAEAARLSPKETFACFGRMAEKAKQRIPPGWQPSAIEVFLSRRWEQQKTCDWRFRAEYLDVLSRYAEHLRETGAAAHDPSLAFQTLVAPLDSSRKRTLLDAVSRGMTSTVNQPARRRLVRQPGPLRLGFISADFREHPAAQLHWRQLALHDRHRHKLHAYSLVDEPGSPLRRKVVESVDVFRDLSRTNATEAAWRIARDGIDILVDITGHLDYARPEILAMRPAPIQVSYMGSPLSLGEALVDYRITDRVASPDGSEFSEAVVRLPITHFMYNDQEQVALRTPTRQECGLPDDAFVFSAFNSSFKIEPEVFAVWMELLHQIPGSVLWLRDDGKATVGNLRLAATDRGIAAERLVFAPWMERPAHLVRHDCADLFLDTFSCNAHTTAADALWAGLPVLTKTGDTLASRLATSLVRAAGLPELAVATKEDYRKQALHLARTPAVLATLRQQLRDNRRNLALFATEKRVRHLEMAFEIMHEHHDHGEAPRSFDIPD